jgi:hypothetical protein
MRRVSLDRVDPCSAVGLPHRVEAEKKPPFDTQIRYIGGSNYLRDE